MSATTRRDFLGFAQKAVAAAAVSAIAVHFVEGAEAMPVASNPGPADKRPDFVTEAQWGPGWGPGPRRGRRRRRWVCWWHRGRRVCGWRWF
ncbi:twin-arginine translocation signal domain-containing protein [Bradyrhizobium sp. 1]|nr:twin-arginine translocation signal domain-containing protein [Bradyrhizobium sp. 1]